MNLRSSSTPRFDGSAIATVSVRPSRLSGRTRCFCARSAGIIFAIFGSTSNRDRSTAGMRCCFASILRDLDLRQEAHLHQRVAEPLPVLLLLRQRLGQLLARDHPLAHEQFAERDLV